ncbi:MAG: alpha-galactosidase, partial [Lachnospiraceae bacterium]|nr:alpha-galactosidase [Lachnospiraceae bacterium]
TPLKTLPCSYCDSEADTSGGTEDGQKKEDRVSELTVILKDSSYGTELKLGYCVFEECDVITRFSVLTNSGSGDIRVERLLSLQLDLHDSDYMLTTFHGSWAREMQKKQRLLSTGSYTGGSMTGTSSNRNNPLMILSEKHATERTGRCYGFNLVYSGNHYECAEVTPYDKTRVLTGIQPLGFSYLLKEGESLEAPEAVMSFSPEGFNGLSRNLHAFVREHIVRGYWKDRIRPVLLNSWEASYFDINESRLLRLAGAAAKAGIELFVMDDGWFGHRNDDTSSLGDWTPDPKKLPGGLKRLCDRIRSLGLEFGIWVEPEMVNTDSDLYRAHPDWCLAIPGRPHSEGRNQRILDLCRIEVQDFIIDAMSKVFGSADISYVKWDMNRIISDYYSSSLPAERQGEVAHRYVLGLYRILDELTKRFPKILFEGCSSGGNRFDLGMLCYFPQIWGSDNTDAICRAKIQNGYSYGYPLETVGAHVSACPNHQTLRNTPLETRFAVAAFGSFGYECNLCDMKKEELEEIRAQIALYKSLRQFMLSGSFYRGRSFDDGDICEWTVVSKDRTEAVGMTLQKLFTPNHPYGYYRADGLDPKACYYFTNRYLRHDIREFGDLVNTVSPVHIRQGSLLHNMIARFYKMNGEKEDVTAFGDLLMEAGVRLKPSFAGTGYDERVRLFPDFASRLYFMSDTGDGSLCQ